MQMVGHDDILRDFRVGVVLRDLFDALAGIFPHRRQNHRAVFDFAEIMFAVLCADGDEIGPAVVIVPPGSCGVDPVFVFEFVVGHISHGMMTTNKLIFHSAIVSVKILLLFKRITLYLHRQRKETGYEV